MTDLRTAAQQALDDLRDLHANHNITCAGTIWRLEAALAQEQAEPVQEPVYWEVRCAAHPRWMRVDEQQFDEYVAHGWEGQKLYTAPPKAEPVQEHEDWCASVTQLLLSYPPQKAPCNCKKKQAEPVQEPVARVEVKGITPGCIDELHVLRPLSRGEHFLYTAPTQRKPLPQLAQSQCPYPEGHPSLRDAWLDGWEAAERAHGIGGQDE